jgi:hypothetical protein
MRRHKPIASTVQLNLRVTPEVFGELEARSKARGITVSELVRQAIDSLNPKPEPSLADYRASWLRRLRDVVEANARKNPEAGKAIETIWGILQRADAKFAVFCGDMATELDSLRGTPQVHELLWGAPALPVETKFKS